MNEARPFYHAAGALTLGSRLRALTATLTDDATAIYDLYQIGLDPRWFPVFLLLSRSGPRAISEIAGEIGHSHASVSQIVKAMRARGIVAVTDCRDDGRRRLVELSATGRELLARAEPQIEDVASAADELLEGMEHDLWAALGELEERLRAKSLNTRVRERYAARVRERIRIDDLTPADAEVFAQLNFAWIERYFEIEPSDRAVLEDPVGGILDRGGNILLARLGDRVLGTVALLRHGDGLELAKMAVDPSAQGLGIGERLGHAAIARARELGATHVYLESNRRLRPAMRLYDKLGFREIAGEPSPYARCDIQMRLELE
ncbi:MAG: bifunctional helix-turn-helix transcriptional regulator/GNAT family N-acetyltransferase [bacterium]|nr:bifunctional helix-turn-helix transcriptional regulator/GNAT family N-acetyltransferase [bacterium]